MNKEDKLLKKLILLHDTGNFIDIPIPTIKNAGIIAAELSEMLKPELSAQEQAFFIAGFQDCINYLKMQDGHYK